jgi:hypothetical protein
MHGTYPLLHRLERLALAKAYLALTRVMADSVFGNKSADHSLLLIGAAIMVGHAENRPLNATKIAHYIGQPRSTVIRKLNEFLRLGVIARHGNCCRKNVPEIEPSTSTKRCGFFVLRRKV